MLSRTLARLLPFTLAAALTLSALPARAGVYTDIWYNPAESGWGVNVVQSDDFMFLTFFVYGADNRPTWYTAQLNWDGARYSGGLYATTGTFFAAPWSPANSSVTQVGSASFTPNALNVYQATLTYTVTGVGTIAKAIERQTLTAIAIGGSYVGGQSGTYSGCTNPAQNTSYSDTFDLVVTQFGGGSATFAFSYEAGLACTMSGSVEQRGQVMRMPGATYRCTQAGSTVLDTTATLFEIKATSQGIEARLAASNAGGGCSENGQFSAVLR